MASGGGTTAKNATTKLRQQPPMWRLAAVWALLLSSLLIAALPVSPAVGQPADDAPVMGRSYTQIVRADGYVTPLPPGSWTLISEDQREISTKDGAGLGRRFYFARIVDHHLMGLAHVVVYRRTAGSLATFSEPFLPPQTCEPVNPQDPGHWKCGYVFVSDFDDWSLWNESSAPLSSEDRLAARALAAQGLSVPQMMVAVQMFRSEAWGAVLVEYSFNPEEAGIVTRHAPTREESDWAPANIKNSPERSAYYEKIKAWAKATYPTFKDDFAVSESATGHAAASPATGPAPMSTGASSMAASPPLGDAMPIGKAFTGSIQTSGYTVPLPAGSWTVLFEAKRNVSIRDGAGAGQTLYLGKIVDHRLMGLLHVAAYRRTAGTLATMNESTLPPSTCEGTKADDPGHWACVTESYVYLGKWRQWNDLSAPLHTEEQAAAGELTARGIPLVQDVIAVRMYRSEPWGALYTEYMFNPEEAGIVSARVPSVEDSDWTADKIKNSPERLAYIRKIAALAKALYPTFKADFASSEAGGGLAGPSGSPP